MKTAETLEYGGKTYRTVKIGAQIWMAENLNYAGPNGDIGRYYEDDPANGEKYGRLYTWNEAMEVCPPGWHLPSKEEWDVLMMSVGSIGTGKHLKARSGWNKNGNGEDTFGFSALPSGNGFPDGQFGNVGNSSGWWGSTEINSIKAYYRCMSSNIGNVFWYILNKSNLLSVRCLRDSA